MAQSFLSDIDGVHVLCLRCGGFKLTDTSIGVQLSRVAQKNPPSYLAGFVNKNSPVLYE